MIISKEAQEKLLNNYMKDHNVYELEAFRDGVEAAIDLVDKIIKEQNEHQKDMLETNKM